MQETNRRWMSGTAADPAQIDAGLRSYMLMVYNYLALGLAIAGGTAMAMAAASFEYGLDGKLTGMTAFGQVIYGSPLKWVIMLAPIGIIMLASFRFQSNSPGLTKILYWALVATMGMSLALVFAIYTGESIARTFFITAAAFGGLSLFGYTTKKNLSGVGVFCVMGLIGLVIASIVNIFLMSSMMNFIIAGAGVLIFSGLTAWDTQKIKNSYDELRDSDTYTKTAVMGAMSLFINFINLFQFLLMFLGERE